MIGIISLRRVALHAAAAAAVVTAVVLWRLQPTPGWTDTAVDPWAPSVTPGVVAAATRPLASARPAPAGPAGAPALGEVTLVAAPAAAAASAVVTRDGLPVSAFADGPVTVLAAVGDTIAVDSPARPVPGARVRVVAVGGGVRFPRTGVWVPLRAGVTVLGRVGGAGRQGPRGGG